MKAKYSRGVVLMAFIAFTVLSYIAIKLLTKIILLIWSMFTSGLDLYLLEFNFFYWGSIIHFILLVIASVGGLLYLTISKRIVFDVNTVKEIKIGLLYSLGIVALVGIYNYALLTQ